MACDCLKESNALLAEHNTKLSGTIVMPYGAGAGPSYVTVTLVAEKVAPRGKKPVHMHPTFCPLCGVRYVPEPAAAAEAQS